MAIRFDGTEVDAVRMDGTDLDKLIVDGTTVWENIPFVATHTVTVGQDVGNNVVGFSDYFGVGNISPSTISHPNGGTHIIEGIYTRNGRVFWTNLANGDEFVVYIPSGENYIAKSGTINTSEDIIGDYFNSKINQTASLIILPN